MTKTFFIVTLIFFIFSCSGLKTKKKEGNQVRKKSGQALKDIKSISEKLDRVGRNIRNAGKEALNYFSSGLFLKASRASIEGDYLTSTLLYEHLYRLIPESDFLKKKYSIELVKIGEMDKAKPLLKELFDKYQDKNVGGILAKIYALMGEKEKAEKIYQKILAKDYNDYNVCVLVLEHYAEEKNLQKVNSTFKKCIKNSDAKSELFFIRGKIAFKFGDKKGAEENFLESYKQNNAQFMAVVSLGEIYQLDGRPKEALKIYQDFLKKYPTNETILNKSLQILLSFGRFAETIPYFEILIDIDPENLNAKLKLGIILLDQEKNDKALKVFIDLEKRIPNSDKVMYYLGVTYLELGELNQAYSKFNKIKENKELKSESKLHIAKIKLIQVLEGLVDEENFLKYIRDVALENKELKISMALIEANYFEEIKNLQKSIDILLTIRKEKEGNLEHDYYLASLYEKNREYNKSYKIIYQILDKNPNNAHALNFVGYSMIDRGVELEKAYKYITKAIELAPDDGYIRDSLGWYYFKVGKYQKALKEVTLAQKQVKDDATIYKHLGMIYESLKNYNKALHNYQMAIQKSRDEDQKVKIHEMLQRLENKNQKK